MDSALTYHYARPSELLPFDATAPAVQLDAKVQRQLTQELQGMANPLTELGRRIAKKYRLICFDEFHVADVTDAMIDALFAPLPPEKEWTPLPNAGATIA